MAWGEHHGDLIEGTRRFFRPDDQANLTQHWLPALVGVEDKLRAGTTVADIGCGCGASTLIMARAYPASRFVGFDDHDQSIGRARIAAAAAVATAACSRSPRSRTTRAPGTAS